MHNLYQRPQELTFRIPIDETLVVADSTVYPITFAVHEGTATIIANVRPGGKKTFRASIYMTHQQRPEGSVTVLTYRDGDNHYFLVRLPDDA